MRVQVARSAPAGSSLRAACSTPACCPLSVVVIALMSMIVWAGIRAASRRWRACEPWWRARRPTTLPLRLDIGAARVRCAGQGDQHAAGRGTESVSGQRRSSATRRTNCARRWRAEEPDRAGAEPNQRGRRARAAHAAAARARARRAARTCQPAADAGARRAGIGGRAGESRRSAAPAGELTAEWVPRARQNRHRPRLRGRRHRARRRRCGQRAAAAQAIVNLIDNAIRYNRAAAPGDGAGALARPRRADRGRDDGPGIAPGRPRARLRALRRDAVGDGYGLGLAIVKEIAERHGGRWR